MKLCQAPAVDSVAQAVVLDLTGYDRVVRKPVAATSMSSEQRPRASLGKECLVHLPLLQPVDKTGTGLAGVVQSLLRTGSFARLDFGGLHCHRALAGCCRSVLEAAIGRPGSMPEVAVVVVRTAARIDLPWREVEEHPDNAVRCIDCDERLPLPRYVCLTNSGSSLQTVCMVSENQSDRAACSISQGSETLFSCSQTMICRVQQAYSQSMRLGWPCWNDRTQTCHETHVSAPSLARPQGC